MTMFEQLQAFTPFNEQEASDRRLMLQYAGLFSDLLTRDNEMAHLTASCWIVNPDKTKVLLAYHNIYDSWAWLGGHADGETDLLAVALREVKEETDADASIIKYVGKSQYTFNTQEDTVVKDVHWYLMMGESYHSKPQREEFFVDSGFYKYHEAVHLLKFSNEKQILEKAYSEYLDLKKSNLWGNRKYF